MPIPDCSRITPPFTRRSKLHRISLTAIAALVLTSAGLALGAQTHPTLGAAHNSQLGKRIVVDGKGQTVYALRPESIHHLLCTTSACLQFWPPVTVSSKSKLKAGSGVQGQLGVLRRSNGAMQVTLGGLPLYRFFFDHSIKGSANGQGVKSFGGTWHVISAKASKTGTKTTTTMTTTTPTYTTPGY